MTPKQRAFVAEYLKDFNATQAAIRAGYSENSARYIGYENLTKPYIAEEVEKRIEEEKMTEDEVEMRYAEKARFDLSPYITSYGKLTGIDLDALIEDGHGHMIRKVKHTKYGTEIEFADQDHALDMIAKAKGMFVNKTEITGNDGGPIPITFIDYGLDDETD